MDLGGSAGSSAASSEPTEAEVNKTVAIMIGWLLTGEITAEPDTAQMHAQLAGLMGGWPKKLAEDAVHAVVVNALDAMQRHMQMMSP